ncbi:MAG: DNA replication protein DnaD [Lachnospiraceae bacterium]|nr:DNA replication protein DnaD [Lachnospiraceae bacterium]
MEYDRKNIYSTGNDIVDQVGKMNISGNVIPMVWFQTIQYPNGMPHNNAIHILADIVYWYRPKEDRDEESGQLIGMRKKFREDLLQRSYKQMADSYGLSKKQVTEAIKALEEMGIIKRHFRNIKIKGQNLNNVLFLELNPKRLYEITYPVENTSLSIYPSADTGISLEGERGVPEGKEVCPYKERGLSVQGETNTKNTNETIRRDYQSINQINAEKLDRMDEIDAYTKLVKENIEYEILKSELGYQYEILDELVEIIVDIVAVQRDVVRVGTAEYPYELVKGKLLKLDSQHIRYVLESMAKTTSHIVNIKAYLLTALYNAPNTINNYYSAEVNHDLYGG